MSSPPITRTFDGVFGQCILFEDRVVLVLLAPGLLLDADMGQRGIPELETAIGPGPYVAVVDGRKIGYVPPDGREAVREAIGSHRVATGFIVNADASQMLADRFLGEAQPPRGRSVRLRGGCARLGPSPDGRGSSPVELNALAARRRASRGKRVGGPRPTQTRCQPKTDASPVRYSITSAAR